MTHIDALTFTRELMKKMPDDPADCDLKHVIRFHEIQAEVDQLIDVIVEKAYVIKDLVEHDGKNADDRRHEELRLLGSCDKALDLIQAYGKRLNAAGKADHHLERMVASAQRQHGHKRPHAGAAVTEPDRLSGTFLSLGDAIEAGRRGEESPALRAGIEAGKSGGEESDALRAGIEADEP